jgi:hypothetical protein
MSKGFFVGSDCSKSEYNIAAVGLVWDFSISFNIAIIPFIRFLMSVAILVSKVSIRGPIDSAGEIPFSSKKSNMSVKVMDWDFDIFLQNSRNRSATEVFMPSFSNRSFLNPLSIFSEFLYWFYCAISVFSENREQMSIFPKRVILRKPLYLLTMERKIKTKHRASVLPSCFSIPLFHFGISNFLPEAKKLIGQYNSTTFFSMAYICFLMNP